jgi:hypothetical protein
VIRDAIWHRHNDKVGRTCAPRWALDWPGPGPRYDTRYLRHPGHRPLGHRPQAKGDVKGALQNKKDDASKCFFGEGASAIGQSAQRTPKNPALAGSVRRVPFRGRWMYVASAAPPRYLRACYTHTLKLTD